MGACGSHAAGESKSQEAVSRKPLSVPAFEVSAEDSPSSRSQCTTATDRRHMAKRSSKDKSDSSSSHELSSLPRNFKTLDAANVVNLITTQGMDDVLVAEAALKQLKVLWRLEVSPDFEILQQAVKALVQLVERHSTDDRVLEQARATAYLSPARSWLARELMATMTHQPPSPALDFADMCHNARLVCRDAST